MHVDFQQNIFAAIEPFFDFVQRRAVKIPVDFGVFQKFPVGNPTFELVAADEIIFFAVDFAGTRGAGRRRN